MSTFFPLPALVDIGRNLSKKELLELPTHVHKSGDPADHVQVEFDEGKPGPEAKGGTPGTWVQWRFNSIRQRGNACIERFLRSSQET